jgi:hypothetical protein
MPQILVMMSLAFRPMTCKSIYSVANYHTQDPALFPLLTELFFRLKQEAIAVSRLQEVGDKWKHWDVIGIDEGQFYPDVSSL